MFVAQTPATLVSSTDKHDTEARVPGRVALSSPTGRVRGKSDDHPPLHGGARAGAEAVQGDGMMAPTKCGNCGLAIDDAVVACPQCGQHQRANSRDAAGWLDRAGELVAFLEVAILKVTGIEWAVYSACSNQVQGISIGWGDEYGYQLDGQDIDVTELPDGTYALRIIIDPYNLLIETNDTDNESTVRLQLAGGTVTVLDRKGRR